MDMERKAYAALKEWKTVSNGKTAILIDGARRVGKSYLAEQFGKREYRSYIIIDFSDDSILSGETIGDMFRNEMGDLDFFFNKLSVIMKTPLYKRESLIIFDEIQCFPLARQRIKKLVADGRFDYIETGSLISIKTNRDNILIPSEEITIKLHPMDFEEFLWALGDKTSIPFVRKCFEDRIPVGDRIHRDMMMRLREYMLVGGMPGAVSEYAETRDFAKTDFIKRSILDLYLNDVPTLAKGCEKKVETVFHQIPSILSAKSKKFTMVDVDPKYRQDSYSDALMWLSDGRIINICTSVTDPAQGMALNADHSFIKCYMEDTGLLVTHALFDKEFSDNNLYSAILKDRLNINEGMLMENLVSQMLVANRHKLFYYYKPKRKIEDNGNITWENALEIDFLISIDGKTSPIEVKSSKHISHSSLDRFMKKYGKKLGEAFIVYPKDLKQKDGITYIPIYMAMFLRSGTIRLHALFDQIQLDDLRLIHPAEDRLYSHDRLHAPHHGVHGT